MFIATYAGRVSSVASSSPLGLPSDSTECSPTKSRGSRSEVRGWKTLSPNLDQLVDTLADLFAFLLQFGVGRFAQIAQVASQVEDDTDLIGRPERDHQKTLEVFRRPFSAIAFGNVDGNRSRSAS